MEWTTIHSDNDNQTEIQKARAPGGWLVRVVKTEIVKPIAGEARPVESTLSVTYVPCVRDDTGPDWL